MQIMAAILIILSQASSKFGLFSSLTYAVTHMENVCMKFLRNLFSFTHLLWKYEKQSCIIVLVMHACTEN